MVRGVWIALLVLVSGTVTMAVAQEKKADQGATNQAASGWTNPVIKGYGDAWNLPDAEAQPQKTRTYKVLFSLSRPAEKPDQVLPGLDHMARMFNVFATRGVPPRNLKVVGVFHGPAASYAAMSNEVYKAKFGVDNPNAKVIQELSAAGVKLMLCGQALHGLNLNEKDMLPDVKLATSALIVLAMYQNDGYALMPF